jgi:hypothetical protein
MCPVDRHDRVRELTDVPLPSPGAPVPLLLADENTLAVAYVTTEPSTGQADGAGSASDEEAAALVVFRQCYAVHFGPPNDEAFATHPLADRGLRPYGAFEVESSAWLRGFELRNRSHPRHDPGLFQQLRHFVWTFQDFVLECAARSYMAVSAQGGPDDLLPRMHALLRIATPDAGRRPEST